MYRAISAATLVAAFAVGNAAASPVTLFEETFDSEIVTSYVLNYSAFAQFSVSDGTVDMLNGYPGLTCAGGSGGCVDLDGSTGDAGIMTSTSIAFAAGQSYTLSFGISGNQRGGSDGLSYGITGIFDYSISGLPSSAPMTTYSITFTPVSSLNGSIYFSADGGDNVGPLLDNVLLTTPDAAVPLPAALPLAAAGLAMLGLAGRKRRRS